MLIKINGDMTEIPEGSTIREAIEISKAPYSKGSIVCLIKGESEIQSNILKYKIKTPKEASSSNYLLMTNSSRWLVSLKTITRNS